MKAVGHTGTLDKFAEGLLILPVGDYTTFSQIFLGLDKVYKADVFVGQRTDSGDRDGIVEVEDIQTSVSKFKERFTEFSLNEELQTLIKIKSQFAPKISALKVGGHRQSDLVRMGAPVVEKERPIQIFSVSSVSLEDFGFSFRIHVSSGTYIRKIVLDLSDAWGIPLTLQKLVREKIGPYSLQTSCSLEEVGLSVCKTWKEILPLPFRFVDPEEKKVVGFGGYLWDTLPEEGEHGFYLIDVDGESLLAWCTREGKSDHLPYRYRKVFFDPNQKIMFSK